MKVYYCEKCWFEECECRCLPCQKCRKTIPPHEQCGNNDRRPWCVDCDERMTALIQAEKQNVAKENLHFPVDLQGRPFKHVF